MPHRLSGLGLYASRIRLAQDDAEEADLIQLRRCTGEQFRGGNEINFEGHT